VLCPARQHKDQVGGCIQLNKNISDMRNLQYLALAHCVCNSLKLGGPALQTDADDVPRKATMQRFSFASLADISRSPFGQPKTTLKLRLLRLRFRRKKSAPSVSQSMITPADHGVANAMPERCC
jgi:hypothetical protein